MIATAEAPRRDRAAARGVAHPTSLLRVIRSEVIKLFTVPAPLVLLLCVILLSVGLAALTAWASGAFMADMVDQAGAPEISATTHIYSGVAFAQLITGALGVVVGSTEFSTGMSRTTFTAVPRRLSVFFAKVVVLGVVSALTALIAFAASAAVVAPIAGHYSMELDLLGAAAQQDLWASVAYLVATALIGLALGMLLRNAAGGIVILAALLFVLPIAFMMIGNDFFSTLAAYLPDAAYSAISSSALSAEDAAAMGVAEPLPVWQAWLTLGAWVVAPLVAAGAVLRWRDL
ncbi:ABC transporter permease [Zhihengliuella flava]|uniref:ABC-type transport system involved in multi-copper enzyme maturation permease subunit n=1 Tax=Zhihengliuella flava TaxID=1285193 RepID=A0A931D589_9MICC|nr:ABC transporter permease [Zhihengliuella flava]MBG6084674.1 ABC-type transport system involved in multi-copper enzyme maturation permease subunit [Zhihengliuella flava]